MEYNIIGFPGYSVTDDRKILKTIKSAHSEKVSTISIYRKKDGNFEYVRLTKRVDGISQTVCMPLDEVFCCAKLGIEPGTPEGKNALKAYRYENGLMGRVTSAIGNHVEEQKIVNLLHADLIRQMHGIGIDTDVDNLTVFSVSQLLFDYLKICNECSGKPFTNEVDTRTGTATVENPIWSIKQKMYDRLITGLRALGLTFERVVKQLPKDALNVVKTDLFESKEREDASQKLGITWVEN